VSRRYLIGVLEIFYRCPGDISSASWKYFIFVLEMFDLSWRYLIGVLEIFDVCSGDI